MHTRFWLGSGNVDYVSLSGQMQSCLLVTADGSTIRELLAHRNSVIRQQSLAEARLAPGVATTPHHHAVTEEIYYMLIGEAEMTLGKETRAVGPGDDREVRIEGDLGPYGERLEAI